MHYQAIISIHALREESDSKNAKEIQFHKQFQSTLSVRRATGETQKLVYVDTGISIHALREESDPLKYIYPHLPYKFQSTLSVRRATIFLLFLSVMMKISIHALREESD